MHSTKRPLYISLDTVGSALGRYRDNLWNLRATQCNQQVMHRNRNRFVNNSERNRSKQAPLAGAPEFPQASRGSIVPPQAIRTGNVDG